MVRLQRNKYLIPSGKVIYGLITNAYNFYHPSYFLQPVVKIKESQRPLEDHPTHHLPYVTLTWTLPTHAGSTPLSTNLELEDPKDILADTSTVCAATGTGDAHEVAVTVPAAASHWAPGPSLLHSMYLRTSLALIW